MPFVEKEKLFFIHIPRNGGSSICRWLQIKGIQKYEHHTEEERKKMLYGLYDPELPMSPLNPPLH